MGGPGLSVAGIAVGFSMLESTRTVPSPYDEHVGWLGLRVMDTASFILVLTMFAYCVFWLRFVSKKKTF
jgi:hypothetical protein